MANEYQPSNYREHGGAKQILTSSGRGFAQGELEAQTGSAVDIQSGSSFSMATDMEVKSGGLISVESGGKLVFESGGYSTIAVQTLGSSQVATNITASGYTGITSTTTGPTYTLAGPTTPGMEKYIILETVAGSSPGTAIVNSNTTSVSFSAGGETALTFNAEDDAVHLVAKTTLAWRIVCNTGSVSLGAAAT